MTRRMIFSWRRSFLHIIGYRLECNGLSSIELTTVSGHSVLLSVGILYHKNSTGFSNARVRSRTDQSQWPESQPQSRAAPIWTLGGIPAYAALGYQNERRVEPSQLSDSIVHPIACPDTKNQYTGSVGSGALFGCGGRTPRVVS